tara:strand:- start:1308 stop:2420 length:1113 start_codon:yes stop_codon:yes gene_type:complete
MREIQTFFKENDYVHLNEFLSKNNCQQYVLELKKLIDEGFSKKDNQCPLSHSVSGTATFDSLLEQITPNIEECTGKKLYPTYAYARLYAPNDELKVHKDRAACEISVTINLGFKGNQWPFYVGNEDKSNSKKIDMNEGDAVIYRGDKVYHWREKYMEGEWQAQVFLHYVDAQGPNTRYKYDGRVCLAHHQSHNLNQDYLIKYSALTLESCKNIIKTFDKNDDKLKDALLVGDVLNKDIRNNKKIEIPTDQGIGATLAGIGLAANNSMWKFNIDNCDQAEYLRYGSSGHFSEHIDTVFDKKHQRKLTIILFLNDDYEGGRLYLKTGNQKIYPQQSAGDVIIFPSFFLHSVEPVLSGTRRTIVSWLKGPSFN